MALFQLKVPVGGRGARPRTLPRPVCARLFAALTLVLAACAGATAQEPVEPARAPSRTEVPAGAGFQPIQSTPPRPRAPRPAKPIAPAAAGRQPMASPPPSPKAAPPAPASPRRVVTVVHRLSGWKLLSLLAASAPPALELDELPSAADVHTNVVAGFLSDDNRTVVVRLPRAEAELGSAAQPAPPAGFFRSGGAPGQSEFTLVLADGDRVAARFVGLDSASGLSLLEAARPIAAGASAGDEGHTDDPAVGQRVVLYAPAPLANAAPPAPKAAASAPKVAPRGDEGVVYAGIGQTEARLTGVTRTPAGRPLSVTASAADLNAAWTGAIATDQTGALVGIVSRTDAGVTQIVPAEAMRRAVERVKATRANVPQPWLGARGDAAFNAPLEFWVERGWEAERAFSMIQNKRGVLLTSVAPGTPAALAGLRPGDLISGVGGRDVTTLQDFSQALKEQPTNFAVDFTVMRAPQLAPVRVPVVLSGTSNPALATAEAEARAARESLLALRAGLSGMRIESRRLADALRPDAAAATAAAALAGEFESKLKAAMREAAAAERRVFEARARALSEATSPAPAAHEDEFAKRPLLTIGLQAIALTPRGAAQFRAKGGLLVVSVEQGSPAEACGLQAGDVIETADGQGFNRVNFQKLLRDSWDAPVSLGVTRSGEKKTIAFSLDCPREEKK